ncbi:hypothetical protein ANN_11083 [Periplaneta americana]|uniref:Integrin beta subunit tail domain-containing protein n=1 Tax=Periplaneta americana TaxID=6978 RepID=A0ABQ8T5R9_PERAM|nr:hypothetical protein ANN_11083 [Periplaneta americana]
MVAGTSFTLFQGYTPNSPSCNNHGDLQCGICACSEGYYGEECQCQKNSNNVIHLNDDACRMNNNTEICSGFGACECGVCTCITRSNPSEHYYGKFCECDNFTCRRHGGLPCAGPDHGTCECGQCICKWGWTGDACECRDGVEPCIKYGSEVCMGRGDCVCGACRCRDNYSGKYCDECPSCPGQQCEKYKDIVECRVFETGPLGKKEECFQDGSITIVKVDKIEEPEYTEEDTGLRICRIPDDAGCTFIFRYVIDNSTVEVQSTKECGSEINILGK